jgi:hypothetical protein
MLYFALLPLSILFELFAKLLSPVLPLFAVVRDGPLDNSNSWGPGPRLNRWLAWFDTPDNSLHGDYGWQNIHCPTRWNSYLGMVMWLWRNTGGGFSHHVLSRLIHRADIQWGGDPTVSAPDRPGLFWAKAGRYWQRKWVTAIPHTRWFFYINFGWLMDTMVKTGTPNERCHYKFSIKFKQKRAD